MTPAAIRALAHRIARHHKMTIHTQKIDDSEMTIAIVITNVTDDPFDMDDTKEFETITAIETALQDRGIETGGLDWDSWDTFDGSDSTPAIWLSIFTDKHDDLRWLID